MQKKILIVGPNWVGDMVMAQTLFKLLKQREPDSVIDVLASDWSRALLERMPEINRAIAMPLGHGQLALKTRYRLGCDLRAEKYQQAFVLPNSWKSALIPFVAKIPRRTGWRGEMRWGLLNDIRFLNKKKLPLMTQRFAALGLSKSETLKTELLAANNLPHPSLVVSEDERYAALQKFSLNVDIKTKPILALCSGAEFGSAKRWPSEHYAVVARKKLAEGWQVWLFGSKKDQIAANEIQVLTGQACQDLTGRTSLNEAIDLMSLASVVISNDSGLMHVAAALGRKLIAVYGSSDPSFTPPLSGSAKVLSLDLSCRPCFQRECPLEKNDYLKCLKNLKPEQVLNALNEL